MPKIAIDIDQCHQCPFFDPFHARPKFVCRASENKEIDFEKLEFGYPGKSRSLIFHTPVPDWCPIKIEVPTVFELSQQVHPAT